MNVDTLKGDGYRWWAEQSSRSLSLFTTYVLSFLMKLMVSRVI